MNTNFNFGEIINATVRADNGGKTDRKADISADVLLRNGSVIGFQNGIAVVTGHASAVCSFSLREGGTLAITFDGFESISEQTDTHSEIASFMEEIKKQTTALSIERITTD